MGQTIKVTQERLDIRKFYNFSKWNKMLEQTGESQDSRDEVDRQRIASPNEEPIDAMREENEKLRKENEKLRLVPHRIHHFPSTAEGGKWRMW